MDNKDIYLNNSMRVILSKFNDTNYVKFGSTSHNSAWQHIYNYLEKQPNRCTSSAINAALLKH
jgi:hypothetical protein